MLGGKGARFGRKTEFEFGPMTRAKQALEGWRFKRLRLPHALVEGLIARTREEGLESQLSIHSEIPRSRRRAHVEPCILRLRIRLRPRSPPVSLVVVPGEVADASFVDGPICALLC